MGALAERLSRSRRRAFVGRGAETELLRAALAGKPDSPAVVFLHGPAGIGKSTLVRLFADECRVAGRHVIHLDGGLLGSSPESFEAAAAGVAEGAVLVIDGFERCHRLETWLREWFLPDLPAGALVVLAGRQAPQVDWLADPAWETGLAAVPLAGLSRAEATELLLRRGVNQTAIEPILRFAGGHPLALTLAAAGRPGRTAGLAWAPEPEVVISLMRRLLDDVPSPAHLSALRVAAHALVVSEGMIRAMLPGADPEPLFAWLSELPFVRLGPAGVTLHGPLDEVVDADFRWRDPQRYGELHARVGGYLLEQVRNVPEAQVMPAMRGLIHVQRHGLAAQYCGSSHNDDFYEDAAVEADLPAMRRMTEACEGSASAAEVDSWFARQPGAFRAYRRAGTGELVAFLGRLRLGPDPTGETDPIVAAARAYAEGLTPLRPGEHMLVTRWLVDPAAYHRTSPIMRLMQLRLCADWIRGSQLAWSFVALADPDHWEPLMTRLGQQRVPAVPEVGGRRYAIFAYDWRLLPVTEWFRHIDSGPMDPPAGPLTMPGPGSVVLNKDQFTAAVRDVLRNWHQDETLAASPLTRTRLMTARPAPGTPPAEALRAVVTRAIDELARDPRRAMLHDVLRTTYVERATTQKAAAARLVLPWSTYRRHLQRAVVLLADRLWQWDIRG